MSPIYEAIKLRQFTGPYLQFDPGVFDVGGLISVVFYSSTQTITIPAQATKAYISMAGGGGGAKTVGSPALTSAAGAGSGAYLTKYLSGLTQGLTLALTVGQAGATTPSSGGSTILASGTQTITTLTAGGGTSALSSATSAQLVIGAGGAATNGDINVSGADGWGYSDTSTINGFAAAGGGPFCSVVSVLASTLAAGGVGKSVGGGAATSMTGTGTQVSSGAPGGCSIAWFT